MQVRFYNERLRVLEIDPTATGGFSQAVVRAFRKVMNVIRNAVDERDIRAMKSLRFEKLQGNRSHQHSLRLNDQWRLIIEIEESAPKNTIVMVDIEDYH